MPEGPEVAVVADVIRQGVGKKFIKAEVIENVPGKTHRFSRKTPLHWSRLQRSWPDDPWILDDVKTHGKLIELVIDIGDSVEITDNRIFAFSTLGMSGSWGWGFRDHKHTRLNFITKDGENLSFIDPRCYGTFRIVTKGPAEIIRRKIGWDLLKAPAPAELWSSFQQLRRIRFKPIGIALLEQNTFAGLGNIYRAEVMHILRINPNTTVEHLDPAVWAQINTTSHQILKRAYGKGGSSVDTFEADGKEGQAHYDHKIYGKVKCPKGHRVLRTKMKDRTIHWCKICQTE